MIYWQGLARWGIRRVEGTREQWGRAVARSSGTAIDDDGQTVNATASWWHASLPDPPPDWPESASLTLRAEEADYLRERIRENCAGTMLAALVERRDPWTEVRFPGSSTCQSSPRRSERCSRHAQRFSERMHGAALLYNHELAKRRGDEAAEADYRERARGLGGRRGALPTPGSRRSTSSGRCSATSDPGTRRRRGAS